MIAGAKEVRVVAQNRGRDMLSLFITFRDVMLSGEYALPLRLHFNRTPQMAWQIGRSLKRHLVESLVPEQFHRPAPKLWDRTRPVVEVVWPILKGFESAQDPPLRRCV